MVDPNTAKEVAQVAAVLLKELGLLEKMNEFLLRPTKHTIILLGASGTGKTSFCRRLRGLVPYVPREMRSRVSESVKGKLKGKLKLKIIETPGQIIEPFSIHRRQSISKAMREPNLGIINVVSYGYHEGNVVSNRAITKNNTVKQRFLENRRHEEILLLDEWKNTLCAPGGPARWLITVCSKADLWWTPTEHSPILQYYDEGAYYDNLGQSKNIDTSVFPFSSHDQQFFDLVRMSGYYTDNMRIRDEAALIARILSNFARVEA
ncbi:MAG: hypothetical protein JO223_15345 [Hyphomicrobiales bacterium]|nr:hypothetical protein [Hyphomicrobiales bacterium]MBV8441657.1 hypothetical protein [Hyphomicrobiales bacterium]